MERTFGNLAKLVGAFNYNVSTLLLALIFSQEH